MRLAITCLMLAVLQIGGISEWGTPDDPIVGKDGHCHPGNYYPVKIDGKTTCLPIGATVTEQTNLPQDLQDHMPVSNDPHGVTTMTTKVMDISNLPAIDVPAVWKTQKVCSYVYPEGGGPNPGDPGCGPIQEHNEWTCEDENRVLLVSVNGKRAMCHLLPEGNDPHIGIEQPPFIHGYNPEGK